MEFWKRESICLAINVVLVIFIIAGLEMTLEGKVRGDNHVFVLAFQVSLFITIASIVLNVLAMTISREIESRSCTIKDGQEEDTTRRFKPICILETLIATCHFIGCIICLGYLATALNTENRFPTGTKFGCSDGFGCANVMALIACAILIFRKFVAIVCLIYAACTVNCEPCCCCPPNSEDEADVQHGYDPRNNETSGLLDRSYKL